MKSVPPLSLSNGARRAAPSRSLVATAVSVAIAGGVLVARAQQAPADVRQLPKVTVEETSIEEGYRPEAPSSPKYTRPLRDTPQTVTVVPQQVIVDQNLMTLREVLSTLPGITFGAGEGGGGYGDSITLRGYNANNDIGVDGVRDSAQYTRSDPFNLEQVEVVNGPSSVYSGSGSVGGTINLVTKVAADEEFTRLGAGAGTDSYGRFTVDTNQRIGESAALRLNAMVHHNDVPGRDYEEYERWGIAPSISFGLGSDTTLSLSYIHQYDDNVPQYGVPFYPGLDGGPLPGVDPSNYYGYHNVDRQKNEQDAATLVLNHRFDGRFSVRNLTRWQTVSQFSAVDPPQGTWCLDTGLTPTGAACAAPGQYQPSGPRGTTRDTKNTSIVNQTDFRADFDTGGVAHSLVAGFSVSHETYELANGNSLRNPDGATPNPVLPLMDIRNPDSNWTGPVNFIVSGRTNGELDNQALYVFDTLQFSPKWEFSAGLRYEHNDGRAVSQSVPTPASGGEISGNPLTVNRDDLLSYRAGLVFKPVENASIYVAYGNSETPSKASVNGNPCTLTSASGNANCNVDPEEAVNYELGIKWDLLDSRLALSAAVFRNERTNYRVNDPNNPDNPSGEQALDGEARVDGVSLGLAGAITDRWQVFANYMYLDSEVIQSVSDYALSQGSIDAQAGNPLTQTPENSGSLWTTYELPLRFTIGYGVTYQGEIHLTNGAPPLNKAPSYTVHRLMASWQATDRLGLRLNVNNLFDEEYYIRVRNNGWAVPGDTRQFVLSANYAF